MIELESSKSSSKLTSKHEPKILRDRIEERQTMAGLDGALHLNFLSENNVCGQTLLRLVARGSAIIAEILRLSGHVPPVFRGEGDAARYAPLLADFQFLSEPEMVDRRIELDPELVELDEGFRETHITLIERFYRLFESVYRYISDYQRFLSDLSDGVFIQHTFHSVLVHPQGRQLLSEALYLYGVMLLLLDERIPGPVRERLLMAYYRYKDPSSAEHIDEVCRLCRTTSYSVSQRQMGTEYRTYPRGYPEEYFARCTISSEAVKMIIGRMRSDDVYELMSYYPAPEHRSTALATQGAMLYITLFFAPDVLQKDNTVMREIVDKFFPDNWIVPFFMGFTVDLQVMWGQYRSAKEALQHTLTVPRVKQLRENMVEGMRRAQEKVSVFLVEGTLDEDYVLENIPRLLSCERECNVVIRWLMLHRETRNKKLGDAVRFGVDMEEVLLLLLDTAQFEYVLSDLFERMLGEKKKRWEECREDGKRRMLELSEYFSGNKVLTERVKDVQLQQWFNELSEKIGALDYSDTTLAGRKIQQLITALEEVEQYHQVDDSLQVKQFLQVTRELLQKMIRYINIRTEVLATVQQVGDISYAWEVINDYVEAMQRRIKEEPSLVIKLRSTFLKLASMLELPLVRILQAKSPDDVSVSKYYSAELVAFVRKVLQVIPVSMFSVLEEIIRIQTSKLPVLPARFPRVELRDYAELDHRHKLAELTYQVSKFTEGMMAMEKTLMGVVQVDPEQLLEDGIRKELVNRIATALDRSLVFRSGKLIDYEDRIREVASTMDGMFRSLEYIQDYVKVYGVKIWQEEYSRIVNYYVEEECNSFLTNAVPDFLSQFQNDVIPIPRFAPTSKESVNFVGRVLRELIYQTDPRRVMYVDPMAAWIDRVEKREVLGIATFSLMNSSLGVVGLTGFDKLLCFMIVKDLQEVVRKYKRTFAKKSEALKMLSEAAASSASDDSASAMQQCSRLQKTVFPDFFDLVHKVGHKQLMRRHIASELNFACKLDSSMLRSAVDVFNKGVLVDIEAHYRNPEEHVYPSEEESPLLVELARVLECSGLSRPLMKIYTTSEPLPDISFFMAALVLSFCQRSTFDSSNGTIGIMTKQESLDGVPFVIGTITLLRQFHSSAKYEFLSHIGKYVRYFVGEERSGKDRSLGLPPRVVQTLRFLEIFCRLAEMDRQVLEREIPSFLLDQFHELSVE